MSSGGDPGGQNPRASRIFTTLTPTQEQDAQESTRRAMQGYFRQPEILMNEKFKETLDRYADQASVEASLKAESLFSDVASRVTYLEKETPIPPSESLNLVDLNLINNFIKNPGTGPFCLLAIIACYGGLIEEADDKPEPDKKEGSVLDRSVTKAKERFAEIATENTGISGEDVVKFFTSVRERNFDQGFALIKQKQAELAAKKGEILNKGQEFLELIQEKEKTIMEAKQGVADNFKKAYDFLSGNLQNGGTDNSSGSSGGISQILNGLDASKLADALNMSETDVSSSPWHIALIPLSMVCVQFSYIFFIFYEALQGYEGGTCPAFEAYLDSGPQEGSIPYPYGADVTARILISFIAAFFCGRVIQQFLLFRNALEGQHTDGGVGSSATPAFKYGFIPMIETYEDIFNKARMNLEKAHKNIQDIHQKREDELKAKRLRNEEHTSDKDFHHEATEQYKDGVKAFLRSMHENIRNLRVLSYNPKHEGTLSQHSELKNLATLQKSLEKLELFCKKNHYIDDDGLTEIHNAVALDFANEQQDSVRKRNVEKMGWKNIKWSWLFPFYIWDCIVQLILLIFVFLVNLYIVFVDGVAARDMILNVVLLDFIYEQLPKFKTLVFKSEKSKALIRSLKVAYNDPPRATIWKMHCRWVKSIGLQSILLVSFLAILASFSMIIYGPICKPGPKTAGVLPSVQKPGSN